MSINNSVSINPERDIFYQFCKDKNNAQKVGQEAKKFHDSYEAFYSDLIFFNQYPEDMPYSWKTHEFNFIKGYYSEEDGWALISKEVDFKRDFLVHKCQEISKSLFGNNVEQEKQVKAFLEAKSMDQATQEPLSRRLNKFLTKASEGRLLTPQEKTLKKYQFEFNKLNRELKQLEEKQTEERKEVPQMQRKTIETCQSFIDYLKNDLVKFTSSKTSQFLKKQLIEKLTLIISQIQKPGEPCLISWESYSDSKISNYLSNDILGKLNDITTNLYHLNKCQEGLSDQIIEKQKELSKLCNIPMPPTSEIRLESITIAPLTLEEEKKSASTNAVDSLNNSQKNLSIQTPQKQENISEPSTISVQSTNEVPLKSTSLAPLTPKEEEKTVSVNEVVATRPNVFKSFWNGILKVKNWVAQLFSKFFH